jgi:DNA (cytosine-5)-methyltransferase 1
MSDFEQLRHVDLCSGIGGFALGFQRAGLSYPVLFCDIEEWCRDVLDKHWPDVPKAVDVKELANDPVRNVPDCDILTAGYPCQPFSLAGQRKGQEDDRHIWPYILQIVAQKRPTWCVFENVYGHISLGLDQVLFDLEAESYAARAFIVPACSVDAPHRRDRVWIVAYTDNAGSQGRLPRRQSEEREGELGHARRSSPIHRQPDENWWGIEPNVGRVAHGVSRRVDRLKGLGNAIVPQIAEQIAITIKQVG